MEPRAFKILEAVIDEYIRTGDPVGSKILTQKMDFPVSSATIRNEMALLEQQGYLEHTHTSSGRVPTFNGYRLYIEKIASGNELSDIEKTKVDEIFKEIDSDDDEILIENASRALAEVTKCAIVSSSEATKFSVITKVDVIPTGKRMYVLLLITSTGNIKNRVCRLSFDLTNEQMEFFSRFVNQNLTGINLENVSDEYISKLSEALGNYMLSLSPLLKAVVELSAEMLENKVDFSGQSNLITCEDFTTNEIATLLESKNELVQLLDESFSGINVKFGKEDESFVVSNTSLITSTFNRGEEKAGSFGIIGPMRLDYKKIIPYIEYFTNKVTNILSQDEEDEELRQIERDVEKNE